MKKNELMYYHYSLMYSDSSYFCVNNFVTLFFMVLTLALLGFEKKCDVGSFSITDRVCIARWD